MLGKCFKRIQQDRLAESSLEPVREAMQSVAKCDEITFAVALVVCRPWEACAANLCRSYWGHCLSLGYATTASLAVRGDRGSMSL